MPHGITNLWKKQQNKDRRARVAKGKAAHKRGVENIQRFTQSNRRRDRSPSFWSSESSESVEDERRVPRTTHVLGHGRGDELGATVVHDTPLVGERLGDTTRHDGHDPGASEGVRGDVHDVDGPGACRDTRVGEGFGGRRVGERRDGELSS